MPLSIATSSASIACAIAERLPGLVRTQGANVIFLDTPQRGKPGIYKARNGEVAFATPGITEAQRSFLTDIFRSEFRQYEGQEALYFRTKCPKLHLPGYLAPSSTVDQPTPAEPSACDIPRLTKLAELVPLLSQGQSFASVQSSVLPVIFEWCRPGFDWVTWIRSDEASALRDGDLLDRATPAQLEKFLTAIQRQDRFADGTLESAYRSQFLKRIAQRAANILQPS